MKRLLVFAILIISCHAASAQWGDEEPEKPSIRERIFTGGGLGGGFSSSYDYVSVSPIIGYRVTPRFAPGIGLYYRYVNYKVFNPNQTLNDIGASVFARYRVTQQIFLHAEYEYLSSQYVVSNGEKRREGFNSVMAGAGFFQPVGRKAGFFLMALYNFAYDDPNPGEYYPYPSPLIIRAGITAGF